MLSSNLLRRAVHNALMGGSVIAAATLDMSAAQAQTAEAPKPLEEVIVTGTRITQPGLEAISPITTITSEEIKAEGATRIEDLLNNLPQVFADLGSNLSNGSTGTATVEPARPWRATKPWC